MAENPPDPVERWILNACHVAKTSRCSRHSIDFFQCWSYTYWRNASAGFFFEGLNSTEAMAIWPHLKKTPTGFVDDLFSCLPRALLAQARKCGAALPSAIRQVQRRVAESELPKQQVPVGVVKLTNVRDRTPPKAQSAPGLETLKWCMRSLRVARAFKMAPPPSAFAEIVRRMSIVPSGTMLARWQEVATSAPPELPVARAKWLASLQPNVRSKFHVVLQEDSIWKTMASWRASAAQYASAIQLWGRAAELCEMDPWPPSQGVLDAYAFFFQHGPSL